MLGSETVGGTCCAHNLREAQRKAIEHFEHSNDIEPIGNVTERVKFYSPTVVRIAKAKAGVL